MKNMFFILLEHICGHHQVISHPTCQKIGKNHVFAQFNWKIGSLIVPTKRTCNAWWRTTCSLNNTWEPEWLIAASQITPPSHRKLTATTSKGSASASPIGCDIALTTNTANTTICCPFRLWDIYILFLGSSRCFTLWVQSSSHDLTTYWIYNCQSIIGNISRNVLCHCTKNGDLWYLYCFPIYWFLPVFLFFFLFLFYFSSF